MQRLYNALRNLSTICIITFIGLLCWQCIDIYLSGIQGGSASNKPIYSMDAVATRLSYLKPWGLFTLLIITITSMCGYMTERLRPVYSRVPDLELRRLRAQIATLPAVAKQEEIFRKRLQFICGVILFICTIGALTYLFDIKHFTSWDLESVIGNMLVHVTPWLLVAFAAALISKYLGIRSIEKEILLLRHAACCPAKDTGIPEAKDPALLRTALYFLALVFIVWGVMNGGLYDVLVKAINICTECIGLG